MGFCTRYLCLILTGLMFVLTPANGQGVEARAALGEALAAAGGGDWVRVDALRPRATDRTSRDLIDWMRLRGKQGSFGECRDFVSRNADWPGMKLLRLRCEYSIPRGANPSQVLSYFEDQAPQTGTGSLRLAEALISKGRGFEASKELKRGWLTFNLSGPEHDAFVTRNGGSIKELHEARLDMLLWRGSDLAVERMLPLVSDDWRKLAAARSGLRNKKSGVDTLIEAVPEKLRNDPGLQFERFLWRASKGRTEGAVEVLLEQSVSAEALGLPDRWADRRRSIARQLMREKKYELAYSIASSHYLTNGSAYADLEWLSGYLALRGLNSPEQAIEHFKRFEAAVETPISLGRAGYWMGRAQEAAGDAAAANKAYRFGALYQSSFYGQLAAEKAEISADESMVGAETFGPWKQAEFTKSSVFNAAKLLQASGQRDLAERFFVHLAETQNRDALGRLGDLALELEEPHIALMLAKQSARQGHELFRTYFPLATPVGMTLPVEKEFALSIARRESEFDHVVVSPAGARGLMQLMPGTAKEVARKIGEEYSKGRLLTDPEYNARLGSAYLADLSERYAGNPVLMAVAYNAGPTRATRWKELFGDPRAPNVDVIDWIENIPFRETRNYVMRVTESFQPYRARLSGKVSQPRLTADLKR